LFLLLCIIFLSFLIFCWSFFFKQNGGVAFISQENNGGASATFTSCTLSGNTGIGGVSYVQATGSATFIDCLYTNNKHGTTLNAFHVTASATSLTIINSDPSSQIDAIAGNEGGGALKLVACSGAPPFSPCEASATNCAPATEPQLGVVCTYTCSKIVVPGATCTDTECPTGTCKSFTCDANKVSYCFGIFIHCSHEYNFIPDCFV
jgi:hypothetical protein